MSYVILKTELINKDIYSQIIDTNFSELINNEEVNDDESISIEDFFIHYDNLFFEIPINGDVNSHKELIKRSKEYVGGEQNTEEIELLLQEINQLRLTILEQQQVIDDLIQ